MPIGRTPCHELSHNPKITQDITRKIDDNDIRNNNNSGTVISHTCQVIRQMDVEVEPIRPTFISCRHKESTRERW